MKHVALLRAVNLAGYNKVGMADLKALLIGLGFADAQTLLQSGNIVFTGGHKTTASLEQALQRAAAKQLELETDFFVRTAKEWQAVILRDEVSAANVAALQKAIVGREVVRAKGRCAYIVYPDGIGRSKLTTAIIEKKLGTRGTARNWNTVLKLQTLASGQPPT